MKIRTLGLLSPGDMGSAVGQAFVASGVAVVTVLSGRSDASRARAERAGLEDVPDLDALVERAELVLAILPPSVSESCARDVAAALRRKRTGLLYADCNAVAPETLLRLAAPLRDAGADVLDVGIVGPPPGRGAAPRFYTSGPQAEILAAIAPEGIEVRTLGPELGRASAMKMVYAALTKGTMTLHTAVLLAAWRLGLYPELARELQESQAQAWARMGIIPFLPADAGRWIGEMEEIARTFAGAGVSDAFHRGAAEIFRLLERSPFADETRETLDRTRTLEQALEAYAKLL